ncbi:MAG: hypothetical protein HY812_11940 [Planctomycetes bacterium]|nr:hypothetical protein [Planctomycetota bacterium]
MLYTPEPILRQSPGSSPWIAALSAAPFSSSLCARSAVRSMTRVGAAPAQGGSYGVAQEDQRPGPAKRQESIASIWLTH